MSTGGLEGLKKLRSSRLSASLPDWPRFQHHLNLHKLAEQRKAANIYLSLSFFVFTVHVFYTWLYTCNLHHIKLASNLSCHSSVRIIWVPNQWSATLLADAQCCWPSKLSKVTRHEECSNFAIILFDLLSVLLRIASILSRGTFRFFSSIATQKHGLAMWGLQNTLTQGGQSAIYLMHNKSPRHGNSKRNIHN